MSRGQEANVEAAKPCRPTQDIDWDADQWIEWVAQHRRSYPTKKLSELLSVEAPSRAKLSPALLLDLVCIDLIEQIRASNQVTVESYLDQFSELRESQASLDLIDAEICIRTEVGQFGDHKSELANYRKRFPELANDIESMLNLKSESPMPSSLRIVAAPPNGADDAMQTSDASLADDFSFDLLPAANAADPMTKAAAVLNSPPIDVPKWFLGEQCISSGDGHWLFRGRDSNTGETMAMKVIRLPSQASPAAIEQLLQACESASRVRSPVWTAPVVAAAQNNYLAVIRPWVFGTHWQVASNHDEVPGRLRLLAQIAYAIQSGYNHHAWHGGLHQKNVIVNHQGSVHLVDAVGTSSGLLHWQSVNKKSRSGTGLPDWPIDAHALVKLILQDDIDVPGNWSHGLKDALGRLVANHHDKCFAQIGDELIRRADTFVLHDSRLDANQRSLLRRWRKKIARWVGGNDYGG
jgi:hypothetical protein